MADKLPPVSERLVDAKREEQFAGTECRPNDLASYWRPGHIRDHCGQSARGDLKEAVSDVEADALGDRIGSATTRLPCESTHIRLRLNLIGVCRIEFLIRELVSTSPNASADVHGPPIGEFVVSPKVDHRRPAVFRCRREEIRVRAHD